MTYDGQDNYRAAYAYGLERIEVQAVDNTRPESQDPLYYLYDGLGSVVQLVRPNGEVRDHYRYDEFGVPAPGAKLSEDGRNVNHNAFGYTGELWDEEDDLLYLRSRYYQPETGRFLQKDVFSGNVTNPLSMHKYAYVENNPINYIDPAGHWKKDIHYTKTKELALDVLFTGSDADTIATFDAGVDTSKHGTTMGMAPAAAGTSWHENKTKNGKLDDFVSSEKTRKVQEYNKWYKKPLIGTFYGAYGRIYDTPNFNEAKEYMDINVNEPTSYTTRLNGLEETLYDANDPRVKLAETQLEYAKNLMDYANDNYKCDSKEYKAIKAEALAHIGMGLHAVQDVIAHQYPSDQSLIKSHLWPGKHPDDPNYDYDPEKDSYYKGTTRKTQVETNTTAYLKIAYDIIY